MFWWLCVEPPMTRSIALSKSSIVMAVLSFRAAMSAASLQTFAISAPVNPERKVATCQEEKRRRERVQILLPGVSAASRLTKVEAGCANFNPFMCTKNISSRALRSG
jgi:hypothetical protein